MKNPIMMIKRHLNNLYKDIKGGAITILLLFLIPVLIFIFISRVEETRVLRATNATFENAVEEAARYGAMMVDPGSQAIGEPLIAYNRAIPMLEEQLKTSLGLDDNFKGDDTTSLNNVEYQGFIYNGIDGIEGYEYAKHFNDYYEENKIAYMVEFSNNGLNPIDKSGSNLESFSPKTFYINDDGITDYYTSGSIKVTMDAPGIILYVKATVNPVIVNQDEGDYKETVARWAYAKIVKREEGEEFVDKGDNYEEDNNDN